MLDAWLHAGVCRKLIGDENLRSEKGGVRMAGVDLVSIWDDESRCGPVDGSMKDTHKVPSVSCTNAMI